MVGSPAQQDGGLGQSPPTTTRRGAETPGPPCAGGDLGVHDGGPGLRCGDREEAFVGTRGVPGEPVLGFVFLLLRGKQHIGACAENRRQTALGAPTHPTTTLPGGKGRVGNRPPQDVWEALRRGSPDLSFLPRNFRGRGVKIENIHINRWQPFCSQYLCEGEVYSFSPIFLVLTLFFEIQIS